MKKKQRSGATGPNNIFVPRATAAVVRSRISVFQQLARQIQDQGGEDDGDEEQGQRMTESQVAEIDRINDIRRQKEEAERRSARAIKARQAAKKKRDQEREAKHKIFMRKQKTLQQTYIDAGKIKGSSSSSSSSNGSNNNNSSSSSATNKNSMSNSRDKPEDLSREQGNNPHHANPPPPRRIEIPSDHELEAILMRRDDNLAVQEPPIAYSCLHRLTKGVELNDIIMEEYSNILIKHHNDGGGRRAHISSYLFMDHHRKGQNLQAAKYMPKPNIYEDQTQLLLVIVKRPGHWICVCCDLAAKIIKVFDPLGSRGEAYKLFGELVLEYILQQHRLHYNSPMSREEQDSWTVLDAKRHDYSHQQNGIDCGVCVLQYFYMQLMGQAPLFTLQQTNAFRNGIAKTLLMNTLIKATDEQQQNVQTAVKLSYMSVHNNGQYKDKTLQIVRDISIQFDAAAPRRGGRPKTHIVYVQSQEWCKLVVRETTNQYAKSNCIKPSELENDMKLLVLPEDPEGPLGPPMLLTAPATIQGQSILQGMRIVRGEGDCLYRALIYSILEQIIINHGAEHNMTTFREWLVTEIAHIPRLSDRQRIKLAIQMLTTGPEDTCASIHNLTIRVADEQNGLDKALIQLTRNIIHQYIEASKHDYFDDDKTIQEMFETYEEGGKTYKQQLYDIITKSPEGRAVDASDQLVYSGLPFAAFRVQCDVLTPMQAGRGEGDYRTERINSLPYPIATIVLICKHIHYNIGYTRKMNEIELFRKRHPGLQEGIAEDEQLIQEEVDNSAQSSSSTTSNLEDGRPHEASAQQNRDYLIPGD
jgi:hypothetical protein